MNAPPPELIVVMPVHNEEGVIASVLEGWMAVLAGMGIAFQIRLYDDGSTDRTSELIRKAAGSDPRVVLIEKENSGHGATILRGYRESGDAEWLFQTDSDDEMPALPFRELWRLRKEADFVIGNRQSRAAPWSRKIVTRLSQWTVWLLFGGRSMPMLIAPLFSPTATPPFPVLVTLVGGAVLPCALQVQPIENRHSTNNN